MSFRQSSLFSYGSRITVQEEEPHYNEMSDEELKLLLEEIISANKILILENEIFERYLMRRNPQCLQTMGQVLESAKRTQKKTSQLGPISSVLSFSGSSVGMSMNREKPESLSLNSSRTGSRRITVSVINAPRGYRINLTHRMEMAKKEIEEMKKNLKEMEHACIRKRANLTARLQEAELRIWETEEIKQEFQEKVIEKGVDHLTGKIPAEKFIRFIEERLKATDNMIEKLRLKTSNVKAQIKKMKQQLDVRREFSETLRPIEFEQLAIENQIHEREIEEKRKHFLEMKKIFGRFNLMVTNYKQNLSDKQMMLKSIKGDIGNKKNKIEILKNEKEIRETEIEKTEQQNKNILKLMDEYTIPDVLDLVKIQAELRDTIKVHKRLDQQYQKILSIPSGQKVMNRL